MRAEIAEQQLHQMRENLYRLLSRLYVLEVDRELLGALKAMEFPVACEVPALDEGYRLLAQYLDTCTEDDLEGLAVDYARVFLAAGVAEGAAAFPYESVYAGKQRIVAQRERGQVARAYAARGLGLAEELPRMPEDHIAVELDFMAHLCREARRAAEAGDEAAYAACVQEQMGFFHGHIRSWVPRFCMDVEKYAATGFYRALGKITAGFVGLEQLIF